MPRPHRKSQAASPKPLASLLKISAWTIFVVSALYVFAIPDVSWLRKHNPKTTAYIELYKERLPKGKKPEVKMMWRPLAEISPHLRNAVVIAEDDMFYRHRGIDWESLRNAFSYNWEKRKWARGGSTITQQLARNLFLSPARNPLRKIKEMLIARRLEKTLGKNRILELYLNAAEWGNGIYGAEAASQEYFQKKALQVTVEEAVSLAAALPSPRRWNPFRQNRPKLTERKAVLIRRMREAGYLPEDYPVSEISKSSSEVSSIPIFEE